jgi:hypothetical protein
MVFGVLRKHKRYIFPSVLLFLLIILTATKISGSSVGFFNTVLFKGAQKNQGLVLGHPQAIRSDELEANTPLTVAQVKSHFPVVNKNIGNGEDMSVVSDVPYKDWSEFFKPQNWSFFVLPLEHAFAFKWWAIGFVLMISCYLFCLQLLPRRYLLSSLISVALFLSPFVQWWYQSITILPIAYGLLAAFVVMRILDRSQSRHSLWLWTIFLSYILTCFALLLYLPFVLPVALVVAGFLIGHFLNQLHNKSDHSILLKKAAFIVTASFVALLITFAFIKAHSAAIKTIQNTVYPGHRRDASGGFDLRQLSGGYYNVQLQYNDRASHLPAPLNQSEASNFILIFPFLIPILIYLSLIKIKGKRIIDWRVILLIGVCLVLLARLFVPFSEFFFNFVQLNRVPHDRLLIAFGMLNVMLLVLAINKLQNLKAKLNPKLVWLSATFAFIYTSLIGLSIKQGYKGYLSSNLKIILISLIAGGVVLLLLKRRAVLAISILVVFSIVSVAKVNPLYKGLSPIVNSKLSQSLQQVGDSQGRWVVSDDVIFENVIFANDLRALSGAYSYPQLELWKPLGTDPQSQNVYNRYAHVFFTVENIPSSKAPNGAYLDPPATDAFRVHADPCYGYLKQEGVRYIFTSKDESSLSCLREIRTITYPAVTYRIYEIR